MRKNIKKIYITALYLMLVLILIPVVVSMALLLPSVQTRLVQGVTARLSEKYHTAISLSGVYVSPLGTVSLREVLVRDQQHDTLLFINKINGVLNTFSFAERRIIFRSVTLGQPVVNLNKTDSVYNFSFLLTAPDTVTSKQEWDIQTDVVQMEGGSLAWRSNDTVRYFSRVDASNLRFTDVNLLAKGISFHPDSLTATLEHLSFAESSGFRLTDGRFSFLKNKTRMELTHFMLSTELSSVLIDTALVRYDSIAQLPLLTDDVKFKLLLNSVTVDPRDWGLFSQWGDSLKAPVTLKGAFSGSLPNLKGEDVVLSFGKQTALHTNFNLVGLPRFNETFLFLDITDLSTTADDINLMMMGLPDLKVKTLPSSLNELGTIRYKGNFTGFINDLVAYGKFTTRLGNVSTDLGVKITDRVTFSGSLNTVGFDLGRLFKMPEQIGRITMRMTVNGSHTSGKSYFAFLKGQIDSMAIRNHVIQNIQMNGLYANKKFDGQIEVSDPIGYLNFSGSVDYSQAIPNFNFFATLKDADLGTLDLDPKLSGAKVSLDVVSNFDGANVDDLTGFFRIDNAVLSKPGQAMRVDSLVVSAERLGDKKRLWVRSDLLVGEINGQYNLTHLWFDVKRTAGAFIPALLSKQNVPVPNGKNNFTFFCYLNRLGALLSFYNPEMELAQGGRLEGRYDAPANRFLLDGELPFLRFGVVRAQNLVVNGSAGEQYTMSVHSDNLSFSNKLELKNFTVQQTAHNNVLSSNVFWNNWDAVTNGAAIFTHTQFSRNDSSLVADIGIDPSQILVKDTVWNISPSTVQITNDGFAVDNFRIWHNTQQLSVSGKVSRRGNDGINGYVRNINVAQILSNIKLNYISFGGMLNAEFQAKNLYLNPSVIGEVTIDDFEFNKQKLGNLTAASNWNSLQNVLDIETYLRQDGRDKIRGNCKYSIDNHQLDYHADVDRCEVSFLNTWLGSIVQNIKGTASGKLKVNGRIESPVLTGRFKVDDGKFDVGLLNTSYTISDSVIMEPQRMVFVNMELRDKYNHKGVFKGTITHNQFSNMGFNLTVEANNMLGLDTRLKNNPLYYGTVFATGKLKVTGATSKIVIGIAAKTMPNTKFYIPVQYDSEVGKNEFIKFSSPKNSAGEPGKDATSEYNINLSGIEMNMDIEATPDAKVQIIFDQRMGDILKGTGSGDIQLKIDTHSNITMFGNYFFEEGEYLFSLQNVINKHFVIDRGSSVKWDGDPFNALIDVNAIYKLNAGLYDLMGSSMSDNTSSSELKKRIPIHCNLYLSDRLLRPSIRFGIETPSLEQSYSALLKEYIHTDEEMNRQVLSLLVLNRFYSPEVQKTSEQSNARGGNNPAWSTTTEMLSNQFSNWLSQINKDVDVDVNYRPGDEISSQEIELALSTQLFNDRVSVSTNVGYEEYQTSANASGLVGDFDMNVKLNTSGTLRAHAYTHTNNEIVYLTTSPTKQGVGLSFREDFNAWGDLVDKYWAIVKGWRNREGKVENDSLPSGSPVRP